MRGSGSLLATERSSARERWPREPIWQTTVVPLSYPILESMIGSRRKEEG